MFYFPYFYGKIAAEYDESPTLLQMVGNLAKRTSTLEKALQDASSTISLLSSKFDASQMQVVYIDNAVETIVDIYHNRQYILRNTAEKITLTATHYIHDCDCDECVCEGIQSKDGFICEINFCFEGKTDITDVITSKDFEIAWCNDTNIEEMTDATIVIWWDGSRFCGAVGKYNDE